MGDEISRLGTGEAVYKEDLRRVKLNEQLDKAMDRERPVKIILETDWLVMGYITTRAAARRISTTDVEHLSNKVLVPKGSVSKCRGFIAKFTKKDLLKELSNYIEAEEETIAHGELAAIYDGEHKVTKLTFSAHTGAKKIYWVTA